MISPTLSPTILFKPELIVAMSATYEKYAPKIFFGLDAPHLHLLTNHLPIFVTLSGLFVLVVGLLRRNRAILQVALWLVLAGIVGGLLTSWFGQQAYKAVRGLADEVGQDWLDLHMERVEKVIWFFWVAAGAAVASTFVAWKHPRFTYLASTLAGIFALVTVGLSGWIADAGGQIRHPEIRGKATTVLSDEISEPHNH